MNLIREREFSGRLIAEYAHGARALLGLLMILLLVGCARPRAPKPVGLAATRVAKADLLGTDFYFLKTVVEIHTPGEKYREIPRGLYLTRNHVVQFVAREEQLDLVIKAAPIDPEVLRSPEGGIVASWPVKHVAISRKLNADSQPTHEEELGDGGVPASERPFLVVDWNQDRLHEYHADTLSASIVEAPTWNPQTGTLYFTVENTLKDRTRIVLSYCFKPRRPSAYNPRAYSLHEQSKFGFFKATTHAPDPTGHALERSKRDWLTRWNPAAKLTYRWGPDIPTAVQESMRGALALWDERMRKTLARPFIETSNEMAPVRLGDLDANLLYYDRGGNTDHRVLGYGPFFADPITGEIIKSDVFLFESELQRAVAREEMVTTYLADAKLAPSFPEIGAPQLMRQLKTLDPLLRETFNEGIYVRRLIAPERPTYELDPVLQKSGADFADAQKTLDHVRSRHFHDHSRQITRSSEALSLAWSNRWRNNPVPTAEKIRQVALSLTMHEVGHNLGLRHNFKGSSDPAGKEVGSTTVMDYGASLAHELPKPGPYDEAALEFGYGSEKTPRSALLTRGFYFCTDEDTLDPVDSFCSQFDSGHTLTAAVVDQLKRYQQSYILNNLRLERTAFGRGSSSTAEYQNRVLGLLLPLRLIFNNASAITTALQRGDKSLLYLAARDRILADASSDRSGENVKQWTFYLEGQVPSRPSPLRHERVMHIEVDQKKIDDVLTDATEAKKLAFAALKSVVLQEGVLDYDQQDPGDHQLLVRGVLFDKMAALSLMLSKMTHPGIPKTPLSIFASFQQEQELPVQVLVGILADARAQYPSAEKAAGEINTLPFQMTRLADTPTFDVNLRHHSLQLLTTQLLTMGPGAELKKLLSFTPVTANRNIEVPVTKLLDARLESKQTRDRLRRLEAERKDPDPEAVEPLKIREEKLTQKRLEARQRLLENEVPDDIVKEMKRWIDASVKESWMDLVHQNRAPIREQYLALAVHTYLPKILADGTLATPKARESEWEEIQKKTAIAKLERRKNLLVHTFLARNTMILATCDAGFGRAESATCLLIRETIHDLEDRIAAHLTMHKILTRKLNDLRLLPTLTEEGDIDDSKLPDWAPSSIAVAKEALVNVESTIREYSGQLANEKKILEDMLKVFGKW